MKKFFAILLSAMLMLSLAVPASAATVNNVTSNHNYNAYQVFDGTQATGETALGDITWGTGVNGDALLAQLKADYTYFDSCADAASVAKVLEGKKDGCEEAKALANAAAKNLKSTYTEIAAGATSVELAIGYWLLVDVTEIGEAHDARNSALLQVTQNGNIDIAKKYSVPTVDKDITAVEAEKFVNGVEGADAEIGDDIEFTLTGTLPENLADYDTYTYVFHDTLSAGLTYNGDVKVYLDTVSADTQITADFSVNPDSAATTGGGTLTVTFANIKEIAGVDADSKIIVVYTAKLNNAANIGSVGNLNEVYLEYTNDPNHTGDGEPTTGKTPEDEVLVFTYELDVTKVDGKALDTKLSGAEFVLYREIAGADGSTVKEYVQVAENDKITDWTTDKAQASPLLSDESGLFKVIGLDAGTYYLKETKAPAGYNLLTDPIKFEIKATVVDGENAPALESLSITVGNDTQPGDLTTGVVGTTVQNNKGVTLPETGGMGTTIFYIVGGVMVAAAVVLLITKKRMSAEG